MSLPTETFTIPRRWSFLAAIEVTIACDPAAPYGVKRGLAVKAAFQKDAVLTDADLTDAVLTGAVLRGAVLRGAVLRGADLTDAVLTGADLTGAVLTDAVLTGADLTGAVLTGAVLRGADLRGEKITRIFARVQREIDPYTFMAVELEAEGYKVLAGCRWFTTAEFAAHVAAEYPDTDKARETLAILAFIAARASDLGVSLAEAK